MISEISIPAGAAPWFFLALFIAGSLLTIWRLERMTENGMKGTVLGTLIMPYCSGFGNIVFACLAGLGAAAEPGGVVTNSIVNNLTNLTLLISLPALIWGARLAESPVSRAPLRSIFTQGSRGDLLLTLAAVFVFTGAAWGLALDGGYDFRDGLVLIGLFLAWQCFHVFDVLRGPPQNQPSPAWPLVRDFSLLMAGAYGVYVSVEWLVNWMAARAEGWLSAPHLGWLSGWLMVLPNALLALYFGWKRRTDILYSSQVGDGHICIPLCLGIAALGQPVKVPAVFGPGMTAILAAALLHTICVLRCGGLPRWTGLVLIAAYAWFVQRSFGG